MIAVAEREHRRRATCRSSKGSMVTDELRHHSATGRTWVHQITLARARQPNAASHTIGRPNTCPFAIRSVKASPSESFDYTTSVRRIHWVTKSPEMWLSKLPKGNPDGLIAAVAADHDQHHLPIFSPARMPARSAGLVTG